ncbi:MAG: hypothetical protein R6X02_25410 [Enhygromyxa sp.]
MEPAPLSGFDPDDPDAWIVLADWLTERGDPRGLILALEASGHDPEALERLRRQHLHRYAEALWPVFGVGSEAELARRVELRWRAGLTVEARLLEGSGAQLEGLLASEAALALARLRCDRVDPQPVLEQLVAGPPRPSIRALTLGDYRTPMPRLERLWSKLPGLRELELLGPKIVIAGLATALPQLERLRLCCELDPSPLRAFESAVCPNLRTLELRLGGDDYFGRFEALAPVLAGRATPRLRHLAITGVSFGDALVDALTRSSLGEGLDSLDLSDSIFAPFENSLALLDRPGLRLRLRGSDHSPRARAALRRHFGERLE